ncbi:MAG: hypothetical protein AABW68_03430 [archaeon]
MIKFLLRRVFKAVGKLQQWVGEDIQNEAATQQQRNTLTLASERERGGAARKRYQIVNMWDHLTFKEGTQAHHITKVLDHEEWISMEEILRRVNELFGILYQNERSLYPYLKTLVDAGLLEANMVGGKMKWRKKNLIITIGEEMEEEVARMSTSQPLN